MIPSQTEIQRQRLAQPRCVINVGGEKHEIMWKLLQQKPTSRLGKLAMAKTHEAILELCESYCLDKNEIYFDRDPALFSLILNYYRLAGLDDLQYFRFNVNILGLRNSTFPRDSASLSSPRSWSTG